MVEVIERGIHPGQIQYLGVLEGDLGSGGGVRGAGGAVTVFGDVAERDLDLGDGGTIHGPGREGGWGR